LKGFVFARGMGLWIASRERKTKKKTTSKKNTVGMGRGGGKGVAGGILAHRWGGQKQGG